MFHDRRGPHSFCGSAEWRKPLEYAQRRRQLPQVPRRRSQRGPGALAARLSLLIAHHIERPLVRLVQGERFHGRLQHYVRLLEIRGHAGHARL
eukprot:8880784-Pyramimonas_sp.AAC.1